MNNLLFPLFLFTSVIALAQPKIEYWDIEKTKIKSEEYFVRGVPHGRTAAYYQNGKPAKIGWYKNGKQDSVWTFFYDDGAIKAIEQFNRGLKQGKNSYFYKGGKLAQETVFFKDSPDSIWTSWYENGSLKSKESFSKEKKHFCLHWYF